MLSSEEIKEINTLYKKVTDFKPKNLKKQQIYEAKQKVEDLGVSIPPKLRGVKQAVGWGRIAVDALAERIIMEGWTTSEARLNSLFDSNSLLAEAKNVTLDALRFGIGFIAVGAGNVEDGEPPVLITAESPMTTTVRYSLRKRRAITALKVLNDDPKNLRGILFTERETIEFKKTPTGFEELTRITHNLNRCPIVPLINRRETGSSEGHSEITPSIINIINSVMRTLLGAEVAREFFNVPRPYILNAPADAFKDEDGNDLNPISVLMDAVTVFEENNSEREIKIGNFPTNSPSASLEMLRIYAQMFAAEAAVPQDYIGFGGGGNPTSAEAIVAAENRLIARAEDRLTAFSRPWQEVAQLVVLTLDGVLPEGFSAVPKFREPGTPTYAATVDATMKLISAGVLAPDSQITYELLRFSRQQQNIIRSEQAQISANSFISALNTLDTRSEEVSEEDGTE